MSGAFLSWLIAECFFAMSDAFLSHINLTTETRRHGDAEKKNLCNTEERSKRREFNKALR